MKRVLSLLLVAAMLLVIPITPITTEAATAEANVTDPTSGCPCCGVPMDQLEWIPWNGQGSTPPAGHYYLDGDYNQTSIKYVMAWDHVVLDLRGHKWSSYTTTTLPSFGGYRMMTIQGYFYLMDTVGNGVVETQIKPNYGGAFLMDVNEHEMPEFHFLSGTIRPRAGEVNYRPGGMIYVNESGIFKMTGGVIENYRAEYKAGDNYSATVASTNLNAGAILGSADSQILIHGGTIRNCSVSYSGGAISSSGKVELKNCTFMNCRAGALGGAVYTTGKQLVMENCDIMNCSAYEGGAVYATAGVKATGGTIMNNSSTTSNGGGMFLMGGTSTMNGTRFISNTAYKWGGNLAMNGGTLNATNVSLEHGVANCTGNLYNGGGNLFTMGSATANFSGGTIRDGYSANQGGNIYVSGSAVNLTGTTVKNGVAYKTGDNIRTYNSTMTLDGANVSGDVVFELNTLTLKGATKIGLNNTGVALTGEGTKIEASGLTEGAEIYLQAGARTAVAAGANIEYFKGAYRTTMTGGGTAAITTAYAADGVVAGYCPHCKTQVAWTAYTSQNETGHFYLTGAKTISLTIAAGTDMVLDLNGYTLTNSSARYIVLGKLSIMDSGAGQYAASTGWVGGKVVGSGYAGNNGGVIHNNGTFNLYGGTLVFTDAGRDVHRGGVVYLYSGTMNMYGGVLDGSAYDNVEATGWISDTKLPKGVGGAFYQNTSASSTFNMYAGHMIGGNAYAGGTAGFRTYPTATTVVTNITGGSFHGGTAAVTAGGNLYFDGATAANGSVNVKNVAITGGTAKTAGGNVSFGRYTTNIFDNCFIANGKADSAAGYGGNIAMIVAGGTTVQNSIILSGNAFAGGNVAVNGTSANLTLDTCRVIGGTTTGAAGSNGGNLIAMVGNAKINGGELIYGVAGNNNGGVGGNICCGSSGTVTVQKNTAGQATKILNGYAKFGGNITVMGKVTLTDAVIGGGNAISVGKDIQLSGTSAALNVGSGVTGKVSVWPRETNGVVAYGAAIGGGSSSGLSSDLNMFVESLDTKPILVAKDGKLAVSGVQLVDANGNTQWCADYTAAESALATGGYIKLFADAAITLTKNAYVDLNGNNATVSGTGKLYGMDSTGDDYSVPTGTVTFTGTATVSNRNIYYAPNGYKYVTLKDGNSFSFHRLGADLTSVTINIDKNAVYFKGKFGADEKLKGLIDTYGIAVSLSGMPDTRLTDSMMSSYKGSTLENDETASGVYITNILKETLTNAQNNNRGRDKIYATAYVKLTDGTTYISDRSDLKSDDVAWSLYDAFNRLDELIDEDPTNFRKYTNTMRDYYAKWKDKGIKDWVREDTNFIAPEKDDTIDILMIGSSFCTYYVEEMWRIANASGVKLRVCNVYYSGCPLSKYYTDWKNGTAAYQFYETTGTTRTAYTGSKSLEWCLAQGDWDVISMQEYSGNVRRSTDGQAHLDKCDPYTDALFPYITSQFPDAKFYFHQSWSFQIGYVRDQPHVLDAAQQAKDAYAQQVFALGLLAKYGDPATSGVKGSEFQCMDGRVPTGEAWQLVREGWGGYTPYDNLCKRTGTTSNLGDYYHDGDLGGGQYLNGLVWFFQVMKDQGKNFTVADIKWQPDNTTYGVALDSKLNFEQLKACAYEAVFGNGWTYNAANYQ